jgi:hypothetical protein
MGSKRIENYQRSSATEWTGEETQRELTGDQARFDVRLGGERVVQETVCCEEDHLCWCVRVIVSAKVTTIARIRSTPSC